jgi:hypothetical protein
MTQDNTRGQTRDQTRDGTIPVSAGSAAAPTATSQIEFVACPQCDMPATVEWRQHVGSTDGPMEHLKIRCASGHWFLLPASMVTSA